MIIPTLIVRDVTEAVDFLTKVLDFTCASMWPEDRPFYGVLTRGADELHVALNSSTSAQGASSAIVVCDNVDGLFESFRKRGLSVPARPESPVHEGPTDQSWGTREVYLTDPSGNTLIYQQR